MSSFTLGRPTHYHLPLVYFPSSPFTLYLLLGAKGLYLVFLHYAVERNKMLDPRAQVYAQKDLKTMFRNTGACLDSL